MTAKTIWVLASKNIRTTLANATSTKIVDIDVDTDEPEFENEWLKNMDFSTQERDVVISYLGL